MHISKQILNKVKKQGAKLESDWLEGYSGESIQRVMKAQEIDRLPKKVIEFLETMGERNPLFDVGQLASERLVKHKEDLRYHFKTDRPPVDYELPQDAFVFLVTKDGNCPFVYLHTDNDSEDPPVYMWIESDSEVGYDITLYADSFISYIDRITESYIRRYKKWQNKKYKGS